MLQAPTPRPLIRSRQGPCPRQPTHPPGAGSKPPPFGRRINLAIPGDGHRGTSRQWNRQERELSRALSSVNGRSQRLVANPPPDRRGLRRRIWVTYPAPFG